MRLQHLALTAAELLCDNDSVKAAADDADAEEEEEEEEVEEEEVEEEEEKEEAVAEDSSETSLCAWKTESSMSKCFSECRARCEDICNTPNTQE